jgi:hypothetical protein
MQLQLQHPRRLAELLLLQQQQLVRPVAKLRLQIQQLQQSVTSSAPHL